MENKYTLNPSQHHSLHEQYDFEKQGNMIWYWNDLQKKLEANAAGMLLFHLCRIL